MQRRRQSALARVESPVKSLSVRASTLSVELTGELTLEAKLVEAPARGKAALEADRGEGGV